MHASSYTIIAYTEPFRKRAQNPLPHTNETREEEEVEEFGSFFDRVISKEKNERVRGRYRKRNISRIISYRVRGVRLFDGNYNARLSVVINWLSRQFENLQKKRDANENRIGRFAMTRKTQTAFVLERRSKMTKRLKIYDNLLDLATAASFFSGRAN